MWQESAPMIEDAAANDRCMRILICPMRLFAMNTLAFPLTLCAATSAHAQRDAPMQQSHSTRDVDTSMNYPAEQRVADRGGLSTSPRQMPMELAEPQGFDRLYEVPGKSGMFYRANGALFLVFERGTYAQVQDKQKRIWTIATVPPGGQYYIGKPDWSSIRRIGALPAGSLGVHKDARLERSQNAGEPTQVDVREVDLRVDARVNTEVVPARAGAALSKPGSDSAAAGMAEPRLPTRPSVSAPIEVSATQPVTVATEDEAERAFKSNAPDAAAWARTLPQGVDRSFLIERGDDVQPRMTADFLYRQRRLGAMFGRALESEGS